MDFKEEKKILTEYLKKNNLKATKQKNIVLVAFLKSKRHITADELYRILKKKHSGIGIATVYRTLKLFCDSGICRELRLDDGLIRYEALYGHEHHDHLICIKCGKVVEIRENKIEELQVKTAKKNGFELKYHRLDMYGICKKCSQNK